MFLLNLYYLYQDHKDSKLSTDEFLSKYRNELKKVRIGCSFNSEHWILNDSKIADQNLTLKVAQVIVKDLKIKDLRLAIRWSNVYKNGELHFDYYDKVFKYFFNEDIKVCLNIGPIKTMRWPEETIPDEVLNALKEIPKNGSVIDSKSELGAKSLEYLEALLVYLKSHFSKEELNKIMAFQGDNEGFNNFGIHKWTTSEEFEIKVLHLIKKYFPNKKIMINSAGRNNLKAITNLIDKLDIVWDRYIIGYNYYFKVPETARNFILKHFDNLWITYPFSMSNQKLKKLSIEKRFDIEISELQGEPWEGIDAPGNFIRDFQYSLIRSVNRVLNLESRNKLIIRYWGIEDLIVRKFQEKTNAEHEKIFTLIQFLNSNS